MTHFFCYDMLMSLERVAVASHFHDETNRFIGTYFHLPDFQLPET